MALTDWLTECLYYDIWQTADEITIHANKTNDIVCTIKTTLCNSHTAYVLLSQYEFLYSSLVIKLQSLLAQRYVIYRTEPKKTNVQQHFCIGLWPLTFTWPSLSTTQQCTVLFCLLSLTRPPATWRIRENGQCDLCSDFAADLSSASETFLFRASFPDIIVDRR